MRVSTQLLKQDYLASSSSDANQRLSEAEQELHSIKIEKRALFATVVLQASEIGTLKAEKECLKKFLADQDAGCETSRNCLKGWDVFTGLHLQYVSVASIVLKAVPAWNSLKILKLCPSDSVRK